MKNKAILGATALFLTTLLGAGLITAFHFGECMGGLEISEEDQTEMQAFQESVQQAIEDEDFGEWKSLMESQLTQARFDDLVEMHNQNQERQQLMEEMQEAWENEDYDTVKQLREQMQENMPEEQPLEIERECGIREDFGGRGSFFERFAFWR